MCYSLALAVLAYKYAHMSHAQVFETLLILMLLMFFLTVGGGLGGQIFNFPLEFSTAAL